jgi:hypothetical protein
MAGDVVSRDGCCCVLGRCSVHGDEATLQSVAIARSICRCVLIVGGWYECVECQQRHGVVVLGLHLDPYSTSTNNGVGAVVLHTSLLMLLSRWE